MQVSYVRMYVRSAPRVTKRACLVGLGREALFFFFLGTWRDARTHATEGGRAKERAGKGKGGVVVDVARSVGGGRGGRGARREE